MHKHVTRLTKALKYWLPFAATIVVIAGMIYLVAQQNYRLAANEQQVQISEDIAAAMVKGATAENIVPEGSANEITSSLSPQVAIYDSAGKAQGASFTIDGKIPELPSGVFDYTKSHGQDRFTWQPRKDLRFAAVLTKVDSEQGGYVLAVKNLRETEKLVKTLNLQVGIPLAAGLAATLLLCFLLFGEKETII